MDKLQRSNIGLPAKGVASLGASKFSLGASKVNSGMNAVTKGLKAQPLKDAKRGLGMFKPKENVQTDTQDVKKAMGLSEAIGFEALAKIEQLLQESKAVIEEFDRNVNIDTVSTGAGGAAGKGKGVPHTNYTPVTKSYGNAVQAKMDDEASKDRTDANQAAQVAPGTGRVDKAYSYTNAGAAAQGAENNAREQDRLEAKAAQEQQPQ